MNCELFRSCKHQSRIRVVIANCINNVRWSARYCSGAMHPKKKSLPDAGGPTWERKRFCRVLVWLTSVRQARRLACRTGFGLTFFPVEKGNDYVLKNIPIFFFRRKRSKKSAAGVPRRVGSLLAEKFISADDYRRPEYEMRIEYPGIPEYLWFAQNFSFRCAASPPASADGHMPPFESGEKTTGRKKMQKEGIYTIHERSRLLPIGLRIVLNNRVIGHLFCELL